MVRISSITLHGNQQLLEWYEPIDVNVNVNVWSRTALIRNRVSRRVCTRQHHVEVSLKIRRETHPIASRLRGATEGGAIYMADVVPSRLAMPMSTSQRPGV